MHGPSRNELAANEALRMQLHWERHGFEIRTSPAYDYSQRSFAPVSCPAVEGGGSRRDRIDPADGIFVT